MADLFYVEYSVVESAADDQRDAAERALNIEKARREAVLNPGDLGKILPSEEIVAGFQDATESTRDFLEALEEACEGLADRLMAVRKHFSQIDEGIADQFNQMRGA